MWLDYKIYGGSNPTKVGLRCYRALRSGLWYC